MFLWIAEQLGFPGVLNLFRYITFRAGAATATALFLGLIIGPKFIGWLRIRQGKGQPIRHDGPQTHHAKRGTPTMGGLMILTSITVSMLLWMDFGNRYLCGPCSDGQRDWSFTWLAETRILRPSTWPAMARVKSSSVAITAAWPGDCIANSRALEAA